MVGTDECTYSGLINGSMLGAVTSFKKYREDMMQISSYKTPSVTCFSDVTLIWVLSNTTLTNSKNVVHMFLLIEGVFEVSNIRLTSVI